MAGAPIWTALRDFVDGETETAAIFNAQLRDNLTYLGNIAYVEFNANDVINSANEAAPVDVVSSGLITYAATPIVIEFSCPVLSAAAVAGAYVRLNLWDGATNLGWMAQNNSQAAVAAGAPCFASRQLTPTAAQHTYKIRGWTSGNNGTVYAGAGGAGVYLPGFIRVRGIPS